MNHHDIDYSFCWIMAALAIIPIYQLIKDLIIYVKDKKK